MSIIEYSRPLNPREIRKYLMRRPKDEIVWEYLRQWREYGELEAERDKLREALVAAVNYVPDLGDVPGIQAALKATEAS